MYQNHAESIVDAETMGPSFANMNHCGLILNEVAHLR